MMEQEEMWKDGIERAPSGARVREVVQKHTWSSSVWISKDGEVWRRHYNWVSKEWRWADEPYTPAINDIGGMGLSLTEGWVPIERAIALAWLPRGKHTSMKVEILDASKPLHASNLEWKDDIQLVGDEQFDTKERWSPLHWFCGLAKCSTAYSISSHGRLRNPLGIVTSGSWFAGRRWAACKGAGMVDLHMAAKLKSPAVELPDRLYRAANALANGVSPEEFAPVGGKDGDSISTDTAYTYFFEAGRKAFSASHLRALVPPLVPRDLWAVMRILATNRDEALGGGLKELLERVESLLPTNSPFWSSREPYGQLKLARLAIQKQGI